MEQEPFWRRKALAEMDRAEWESLCDGCGKCCLIKLEDEDTGEILHTDVACHLLDLDKCRCSRYADRQVLVPDCVKLDAENIGTLNFMPSTCAYRLLSEGKDLPSWHPLMTGKRDSTRRLGMSIRFRAISEAEVRERDLVDHIVEWPE